MAQTETQQYKVLKLIDNIEIREYPPVMKVKSTSKINNWFGKLFKYISGDNESGTKISMTSPVYMDKENENYIMEFVLPKKFNEINSPKAFHSRTSLLNLPLVLAQYFAQHEKKYK